MKSFLTSFLLIISVFLNYSESTVFAASVAEDRIDGYLTVIRPLTLSNNKGASVILKNQPVKTNTAIPFFTKDSIKRRWNYDRDFVITLSNNDKIIFQIPGSQFNLNTRLFYAPKNFTKQNVHVVRSDNVKVIRTYENEVEMECLYTGVCAEFSNGGGELGAGKCHGGHKTVIKKITEQQRNIQWTIYNDTGLAIVQSTPYKESPDVIIKDATCEPPGTIHMSPRK